MGRLEGKTALITGAARGLGAAIAEKFASEGGRVIVNDLNLDNARKVADRIGGHAVAADVSDPSSVASLFAEVAEFAPRLDVLVNNAGISGLEGRNDVDMLVQIKGKQANEIMTTGKVETHFDATTFTTDADWRRMQAVHVDGTFYCCREALKIMNPFNAGSIINISSIIGTFGRGGSVPYATAKAAILGLTRALAHEVGPRGIRVNAIAPGWIDTDMIAPLKALHPALAAQTPLLRLGSPDDVAWAAVYLGSNEATFLTGQVISPNGGWYMSQ